MWKKVIPGITGFKEAKFRKIFCGRFSTKWKSLGFFAESFRGSAKPPDFWKTFFWEAKWRRFSETPGRASARDGFKKRTPFGKVDYHWNCIRLPRNRQKSRKNLSHPFRPSPIRSFSENPLFR